MTNAAKELEGHKLATLLVSCLEDKKADEITTIDVRKVSSVSDWIIVCEGDNSTHIRAIAEHVLSSLKKHNTYCTHREGLEESRWVLIDYIDVVVHIMLPQLREYYDIEGLWKSAQEIKTDTDLD